MMFVGGVGVDGIWQDGWMRGLGWLSFWDDQGGEGLRGVLGLAEIG